jgi:hypothetical protein
MTISFISLHPFELAATLTARNKTPNTKQKNKQANCLPQESFRSQTVICGLDSHDNNHFVLSHLWIGFTRQLEA